MSVVMRRALAVAGVAAVAVAGCGPSRDYAVPDRLCGVPVAADVLSPLLREGDKLAESSKDKGHGSVSCRVTVDNTLVLYLAGDVTNRGTARVSLDNQGLQRLENPALVEGVGDAAAVADRGAMAKAKCTYQGEPREFVGLVQLEGEDLVPAETSRRRDALVAFMKSWFPAAAEADGCVR